MTNASSKKLKIDDVEVDVEAHSHGVPQENILEAQVEVPSQEAIVEDVEVPLLLKYNKLPPHSR
ncbi:hypothetical protein Tco_1280623, partial [Tanacetum coccineum]